MSDSNTPSSSPGTFYYRPARPDGSLRPPERPVRPGYNGNSTYVPPARRQDEAERVDAWGDSNDAEKESEGVKEETTEATTTSINTSDTASAEVNDSDEYSWAEEDSPVVKKFVESESECSSNEVPEVSTATNAVKREPSKLATAIDDALDNLSFGSSSASSTNNSNGGERQIGRFAAQIRDEQRNGSYYNRSSSSSYGYERRTPYARNDQSQRGGGYNSYDRPSYDRQYRPRTEYSYSNGSENISNAEAPAVNPASNTNSSAATTSLSPSQSYAECPRLRCFLDSLSKCRREMALINAKLEYIRYMRAAKDEADFTAVERERVDQEAALLTRMNALYEQIENLEI